MGVWPSWNRYNAATKRQISTAKMYFKRQLYWDCTDWKVANVVPIFKSGKNNLADNYRPISLTSVVVKTLERLIHKHIMKYLTDFQLLNDNQHGFRPSRSCVTQLLQLVNEWFQPLDKLGSVDAVFLDFAKTFDKKSPMPISSTNWNAMVSKARF